MSGETPGEPYTVVNYIVQGRPVSGPRAGFWLTFDTATELTRDATLKMWQDSRNARYLGTTFRLLKRTALITDEVVFEEPAPEMP